MWKLNIFARAFAHDRCAALEADWAPVMGGTLTSTPQQARWDHACWFCVPLSLNTVCSYLFRRRWNSACDSWSAAGDLFPKATLIHILLKLLDSSTVSSGSVEVLPTPRLSSQVSVCPCLASRARNSPLKGTALGFLYLPCFRLGSSTCTPWKFPWTDLVSHCRAWKILLVSPWLTWWICSTLSANVQTLNFLLEMGHNGYWQHFQNLRLRGSFRSRWGGCWPLFNASV